MNLRLRLIVAFFLLSVVPLAAVTLFTYTSNAQAMRDAAGREAELLAGELSQRMQVVTAQLSERVGHLIDVAEARAEASAANSKPSAPAATGTPEPTAPVEPPAQEAQVAQALGEMALLLNNIELRGVRGPRRGAGRQGPPTVSPDRPPLPGAPPTPDPNPVQRDRILIDIGPMRRDIVRQFVPEGQWEKLTEQERQRIIAEVNQRMLGIAQGIQMGAAEAQKMVAEAQREADAKAQAAAAAEGGTGSGAYSACPCRSETTGPRAAEDGALGQSARRDG